MILSPCCRVMGPVTSNTGRDGEPRQVNRMLRLMRSMRNTPGGWCSM